MRSAAICQSFEKQYILLNEWNTTMGSFLPNFIPYLGSHLSTNSVELMHLCKKNGWMLNTEIG